MNTNKKDEMKICSGLLCCDECGRIHHDHIDEFPICECGRDKSRMEWATTEQVVAYEYGRLDKKYNMGFSPRPRGAEKSYKAGYQLRWTKEDQELASYKESLNHGWH